MPDAPAPTERATPAGRAAPSDPAGRHLLLLVAVCALLFLPGAAGLPLTDPEESRCAQIVREMIRSGDWLMPHLFGKPYFDKPAPFFWLAAAGEWLTGSAALGGRAVAALAGLAAVLTTWLLGRRIFGATAGLAAGLALATSLQFWYMARWYRMDMPFAAAMWAAIAWFWWCERRDGAAAVPRWVAWCGFYLFGALATLFKGPAGLGLPVLVVGGWLLLSGQPRRIAEFFDVRGIAVYLLVVLPWYVAVSLEVPAYAYQFLFRQNLMRFGSAEFGHTWPGILFVPILLFGLLPWTVYLLPAVLRLAPRRWSARAERPLVLGLWLAAIIPLAFFAFSKTKIVGYILPCFPPLAVLVGAVVGNWIDRGADDRLTRLAAPALVAAQILLWAAAAAVGIRLAGTGAWVAIAAAACAAAAGMMVRSLARQRRRAFFAWAAAGFVGLLLFVAAYPARAVYEQMSTRSLAAAVPAADRAGDDFVMWPKAPISFAYYLDLPDPLRLHRIGRDDLQQVAGMLCGTGGVYVLVTGEGRLRELDAQCPGRVRVAARSGDRWLVSNHALGTPARSEAAGAARE